MEMTFMEMAFMEVTVMEMAFMELNFMEMAFMEMARSGCCMLYCLVGEMHTAWSWAELCERKLHVDQCIFLSFV